MARASGARLVFDAARAARRSTARSTSPRAGVETGGAAHNRRFTAPALTSATGSPRSWSRSRTTRRPRAGCSRRSIRTGWRRSRPTSRRPASARGGSGWSKRWVRPARVSASPDGLRPGPRTTPRATAWDWRLASATQRDDDGRRRDGRPHDHQLGRRRAGLRGGRRRGALGRTGRRHGWRRVAHGTRVATGRRAAAEPPPRPPRRRRSRRPCPDGAGSCTDRRPSWRTSARAPCRGDHVDRTPASAPRQRRGGPPGGVQEADLGPDRDVRRRSARTSTDPSGRRWRRPRCDGAVLAVAAAAGRTGRETPTEARSRVAASSRATDRSMGGASGTGSGAVDTPLPAIRSRSAGPSGLPSAQARPRPDACRRRPRPAAQVAMSTRTEPIGIWPAASSPTSAATSAAIAFRSPRVIARRSRSRSTPPTTMPANTSARIFGPCLRPMTRMTAWATIPPAKKLMKIEKNPIRDAMNAATSRRRRPCRGRGAPGSAATR